MRTLKLLSVSSLLLLLVAGCGPSAQNIKNTAPAEPAAAKSTVSIYPHWVENPVISGYLSVVGSARVQKNGSKQTQYRVALLTARAELSRVYNAHVKDTSTTSTTTVNSELTEHSNSSDSSVSSRSALQLSDAVVLKEWTHPETGELFIWLALPLK